MNRIQSLMTVLALTGAATVMGQTNLITNPGFESSGAGWSLWKDASASEAVATVTYPTTGARSGTRYAQVVVTTPSVENWHIQFQPPATWDAGIGATYEMKFWAKSANSTGMHFSVQDGPANGFMYRSGFDFSYTPEWTEYTFSYTSDVEGTGALRFFLYVGANVDTLGFDDFSLVQTAASVKDGLATGGRKGMTVKQGRSDLAVTVPGQTGSWKAELYDLQGAVHASTSGRGETLTLEHSVKPGTYFVRALSGTKMWVHKLAIR